MSFWDPSHKGRINHLFEPSQHCQARLPRILICQIGSFLAASTMLLGLALVSPVWADGVFHDHCGQGDCVREWANNIMRLEGEKFSVIVNFGNYKAEDNPVKFSSVSKERDIVSCKKSDAWVTMKVYADNGESKTPPDLLDEEYSGNDRTHLWNAVCLGRYPKP